MKQNNRHYRTLRLILGDQLNLAHSWFEKRDADVVYVIAEMRQEATYVRHHVQKLCAFFAAMSAFAATLEKLGHNVIYLTLNDNKYNDLSDLIKVISVNCSVREFEFQSPDEYRLQQQLRELDLPSSIRVTECDSEHFLLGRDELGDYIAASKHNRMESFYRRMRKRFDLLMDGDEPAGGQWNYDSENRQKLKQEDFSVIPEPLLFDNDVTDILQRLDENGVDYFGRRADSLPWPISRDQSLRLLEYFCRHCLPDFGRFQDAMTCRHPHSWSLYHSRLSFALNSKMLHPLEVMRAALEKYEASDGSISLAQIEGFIRQILGWREYVRAVYWVNMPAYAELNELQAERDLPAFFWHGQTRMNCMRHAIGQSLDHAYAHHIQRLMITGNFCLLAGVDPERVDAWYLGVYIDAIEWVEMPNTRGMSQFADGGLVATKPYSAGANYVNKMSDYCRECEYDYRDKTTPGGCPFSSLYWDFMVRHRDRLAANPRIGMIYRNWDRQSTAQRDATLARADWCLEHLDDL